MTDQLSIDVATPPYLRDERRRITVNGYAMNCWYWKKPIPNRDKDWQATSDDYTGGEHEPVGNGATLIEAVTDLLEQLGAK